MKHRISFFYQKKLTVHTEVHAKLRLTKMTYYLVHKYVQNI